MRIIDFSEAVFAKDLEPTMFDEVVIQVGNDFYEVKGFESLLKGGSNGPGILTCVAGERIEFPGFGSGGGEGTGDETDRSDSDGNVSS